MAYTPGPWHRNIKPARKYPVIFAGRNTYIAIIQSQSLSDDEVEGNCDLIHAAPELLECARLLERCLVYEIKKSQIEGDEEGSILKLPNLSMVRAAIAKAEGKFDV